jgi:hypothetical protein
MFIECVMANFTKKDVNQIIVRMTYDTPEKLNNFTDTEHVLVKRLKALIALADAKEDIKETFYLLDLVESWYDFCDECLDDEWTYTCKLIKSFRSLNDYDTIWTIRDSHKIGVIHVADAIITESENQFTKKELKCIVDYFNDKIRAEEEQSKAELYTKIKEEWLQFYLNQEV